jgi:hypothetical protein
MVKSSPFAPFRGRRSGVRIHVSGRRPAAKAFLKADQPINRAADYLGARRSASS